MSCMWRAFYRRKLLLLIVCFSATVLVLTAKFAVFLTYSKIIIMEKNDFMLSPMTSDSNKEQYSLLSSSVPRQLVIVMWTSFLGDINWQNKLGIRAWSQSDNYTCEFTADRGRLAEASYVVFHAQSMWTEAARRFPPYRLSSHRWVYFNLEAPTYLVDGPLNDYRPIEPWWLNETFNFTSSYRLNDDLPQPYGKCVRQLGGMEDNNSHVEDVIKHKSKLVAWLVSHCNTFSRREVYVADMRRHGISVDEYGGCGGIMSCSRSDINCDNEIHRTYKFYLSLENSLCQDYITEKVFRPLRHKYPIVPIVMGLADYASILPPHSYIDVRWFPSAQSLARYLVYLDGNVTEYSKYFAWRRHYKCDYYTLNFDAWCHESLVLHDKHSPQSVRAKQWTEADACVTPEVYWHDVIPPPHDIYIPSFIYS
jgi:hypothetical protein